MATLMPLSDANCHMCLRHHGRVVMLLEKRCLLNYKCCGLGFYSPCYILFLTCKSPKSQSPHEVLAESPIELSKSSLVKFRATFVKPRTGPSVWF